MLLSRLGKPGSAKLSRSIACTTTYATYFYVMVLRSVNSLGNSGLRKGSQ